MKKLIKKFLDTSYDGPVRVTISYLGNSKQVGVYHNDDLICHGIVNDTGTYMYISWSTSYEVNSHILKYIPAYYTEIDSIVVEWARQRCKKQDIPFIPPSFLNLK